MKEYQQRPGPERPTLKSLEASVDKDRLSVAEHEFTHIIAIWGVGKSIQMASVIPTSEYEGVTIPGGEMNASQMQIAAMASADHSGNGSDQMKAYVLQSFGGTSMGQAEAIAKSIISSYRADVLHVAAMYLAMAGSAGDSELRQYLRWAEEDIKNEEQYTLYPIPSWSDELDSLKTPGDSEEKTENTTITYHADGTEEIFCRLCRQIDRHEESCPNYSREVVIFVSPTS